MGERLKNSYENEIKVAYNGDLFEEFNYSEVNGYNLPKPLGLVNTVNQVLADYHPLTGSPIGDLLINDQIDPAFSNTAIGAMSAYNNELWREGFVQSNFADPNNVLLGPDWDIGPEYLLLGGSFSSDESPTLTDRIVVFSPDKNILEQVNNKYKTVLLPRIVSLYEFLNLSRKWYEGSLAILIQ